jgi:hypothetical protein
VAAEIRIDQPDGAGSGVAGEARTGIWVGKEVEFHDVGSGSPTKRQWTIDDPAPGSTAELADATTATATFTPDEPGSYTVTIVRNDSTKDRQTRVIRVTKDENGDDIPDLYVLPAAFEEAEHSTGIPGQGPAPDGRGYAPLIENLLTFLKDLALAATPEATPETLAMRDESGDLAVGTLKANTVLRDNADFTLELVGESGVTLGHGEDLLLTAIKSESAANTTQVFSEQTNLVIQASQTTIQGAANRPIVTATSPVAGTGRVVCEQTATEIVNPNSGGSVSIKCGTSERTVCTVSSPSAGVGRMAFGQTVTNFVAAIASSAFAFYCEVAENLIATLSRPASNTAQLEFGQLVARVVNAVSSGQILFRASSASGSVALDGQAISYRNESGFGDWRTEFNRLTALNSPTSTLPTRGRYEQQDIDTTNRGQRIALTASGMYEHESFRGAGKTPRQSIPRQAFNERFQTAGEKTIGTVLSTELFDNYGAVADVKWIAHNLTDDTWSAGSFTAVIFRKSGAPWVEDQNPYGIGYDGIGATDASSLVAIPYLTTASNNVLLKCETGNTDTIDITAFVEIFAGQQRTS